MRRKAIIAFVAATLTASAVMIGGEILLRHWNLRFARPLSQAAGFFAMCMVAWPLWYRHSPQMTKGFGNYLLGALVGTVVGAALGLALESLANP